MKRFDALLVIIAVCLIVSFGYLIVEYAIDNNLLNANTITGEQRAIAIQSTLNYDALTYGKMVDNDTFRDYRGINYTFGKIVRPALDYYCYNASKNLVVVPVKSANTTYYYTVNLDKNETVTIFKDEENELVYQEKMKAIEIALNDTYVNGLLQDNDPYYIVSVHQLNVLDAGCVNYSGKVARVYISGHRGIWREGGSATQPPDHISVVPTISYEVIVDIQNDRELDLVQYFPSPILAEPIIPETAFIPPGAYRSHLIPVYGPDTEYFYNGTIYFQFMTGLRFEPSNASVCVAIVDRDNLEKLNNGSAWESAKLVDQSTNETKRYDLSPITSGWTAQVKTQFKKGTYMENEYVHSENIDYVVSPYYLLIKNNDTRDVRVEYVDGSIDSNPNMEYTIPAA